LPISVDSKESLTKWLWKIHGSVNDKLREQKQKIPEDPPFALVKEIYEERLAYGCTRTEFPGWEFLFSIVENHPLARETSSPMPGAPPLDTIDPSNHQELLKWNYLSGDLRYAYICKFWSLLPSIMPFQEWKTVWDASMTNTDFCTTKTDTKKKLWSLRCTIESQLELLNRTNYKELCTDLRQHKSGCSKNRRARTCRKKNKS
jgi:hypothetical protein